MICKVKVDREWLNGWSVGFSDGITGRIYFDWKCQNEINLFILASLLLQHSDEIYKRKICQCKVWIYFTLEIYLCRLYTVLGLFFHPCKHANSYILQSLWSLKEILTSKNLQSSHWCLPPPHSLYFSLFSRSDSQWSSRCWSGQMIWKRKNCEFNHFVDIGKWYIQPKIQLVPWCPLTSGWLD